MTYLDIITDALRELNAIDAEQDASAADAAFGLRKLVRIFDNWNSEGQAAYVVTTTDHTLVPSTSPHTIGPSGTFTATRPESIEQASIVAGGIVYPLTLRDRAWYDGLTTPTLTTDIPTDLHYRETYPNGSLYLWPVPSAAYTLRIAARVAFSTSIAASDTFSLPPGYQDAVTLTLAEDLAGPFGAQIPPTLPQKAMQARARIFRANNRPPSIQTVDAGMPNHSGGHWDYRTGLYS